ncbi:MAG TPA: hypothetical protein DCZ95_12290 [Verrucomicrobia bacterium]|nr:MAG: hypothetical protein A2X46_14335 [Lentisphaerae bacterium GWF2_57_35]HBA84864.1 hypothetical protein [Verrucomicrobiota bacterium]
MSDQEIIAVLVKERERCRQLVQLYQSLRAARDQGALPDPEVLQTANRILTQVLTHIRDLPRKPSTSLDTEDNRQEARRLLREIGDLLERAIVAERETRERATPKPAPPAGAVMNRAMRMYAGT